MPSFRTVPDTEQEIGATPGGRLRKNWVVCILPEGTKSYMVTTDTTEVTLFGYTFHF